MSLTSKDVTFQQIAQILGLLHFLWIFVTRVGLDRGGHVSAAGFCFPLIAESVCVWFDVPFARQEVVVLVSVVCSTKPHRLSH